MIQLVDYSFARPSLSAIVAAWFTGVVRYLSATPGKNLSASERDALHAAGLSITLVWETDGITTGGPGVGAAHARTANAQADALGYPADCPIFYATDHDYTAAQVTGYYQGVASAGGRPWGIYGGIKVIGGIDAPYYWQTGAWSGPTVSPRAHLYQQTGGAPIPGTDVNDLRRPLPVWVGGLGGLGRSIGGASTLTINPGATTTPPTTAPRKAHTMKVIKAADTGEVWVTDGIEKRYVTTPPQITDLLFICDQTELITIGQFTVDRIPTYVPTTVDVGAIAAAVVKALPPSSTPLTAADVATELAKRLAS